MLIEKYDLTATEAAAALGLSTNTIYALLASGKLRGYKLPGHNSWRIPSEEVKAFALRRMMEMQQNA